jgi:hypothetical protein
MNIDTSKLKSTHWSDLFLQMNDMYNCSDCLDYARTISYKEFWDNSPRGDWLLFFAAKEGSTPHKLIVKAACQCARLSLPYVKKGDLRPRQAIEITEKWIEDKATIKEVNLAAEAAYVSDAANTSYAAYRAAYHAAYAYAVNVDAAAAYAAYPAYSAIYTDSKKEMQQKTADIVRSIIPIPTQAVNEFERLIKIKAFW